MRNIIRLSIIPLATVKLARISVTWTSGVFPLDQIAHVGVSVSMA